MIEQDSPGPKTEISYRLEKRDEQGVLVETLTVREGDDYALREFPDGRVERIDLKCH